MPPLAEWASARIARRIGARRSLALVAVVVVWVCWTCLVGAPTAFHDGVGRAQADLPKVDRSALEKLRLLEIHDGIDPDLDDPARPAGPGLDRPPLVNDIPEHEKPHPLAPVGGFTKIPAAVLDHETCGAARGHGCQFLVPAWLGEQETKAQQHLYQLGLLALATNRTLVLPNVSKSRLGTCYRHPFSFYYSPDSLASLGIPTISQEDFLLWTLQRDPPPSAQVVSIVNAKPGVYPEGSIEIDSFGDAFAPPSKPNRNLCLRSPRSKLDFNSNSPLAIYPPEGYHKSETGRLGFGQSVINALSSTEIAARSSRRSSSQHDDYALPDVLAFNYEMRFPILTPESVVAHVSSLDASGDPLVAPLPFAHFAYADLWSQLADSISSRLSPFIAIHWRTETLSPANLAPCAASLLDKVFSLHREYPEIEHVYLATDYPIEDLDPTFAPRGGGGTVAHSGTFAKVITEQHHKVMRKFLRDFETRSNRLAKKSQRGRGGATRREREEGGLRLTTLAKEQNKVSLDRLTSTLKPDVLSQLVNLTLPYSSLSDEGVNEDDDDDDDAASEQQRRQAAVAPRLDLGQLDPGLLGIVDKLVVTRAELFLTGVAGSGSSTVGACAKLSSFTTQLIGAREALVAAQQQQQEEEQEEEGRGGGLVSDDNDEEKRRRLRVGRLWNTVQHWSLTGEEVD